MRCRTHLLVAILFQSPWTSITSLSLYGLTKEAYKVCVNALNGKCCPGLDKLENLMWSLAKMFRHVEYPMNNFTFQNGSVKCMSTHHIELLDPVDVPTLTHLTLNRFIFSIKHLYMVTQSSALTKLKKLDISDSERISGTLSILLCHSFPSLNVLILSRCGLNSDDLCSLALANGRGRLPELRYLDVSQNDQVAFRLECLFPKLCTWRKLCHLNIIQIEILNPESTMKISDFKLKPNQLPRLQELKCAASFSQPALPIRSVGKWENLQVLNVVTLADSECLYLLSNLVEIVERGYLPSLRDVRFVNFMERLCSTEVNGFLLRQKLRKRNICFNNVFLHVADL